MYPGIIYFNFAHIHCPFRNVLIKINYLLEFFSLIYVRDEKKAVHLEQSFKFDSCIILVLISQYRYWFLISILSILTINIGTINHISNIKPVSANIIGLISYQASQNSI